MTGPAELLNLSRYYLEARAQDPANKDRAALRFVHRDRRIESRSYGQLWEEIQGVGRALLARGLEPGQRVLIRLPHSLDYALVFFGACLAGLVPIPSSPQLTPPEASLLLEDSGTVTLLTCSELRLEQSDLNQLFVGDLDLSATAELPLTRSEDPAFLIYTSGTSSRPKGVLHAHRTVKGRALMRRAWQGFEANDVVLHAGTLNWSYTLGVGLMDVWAAGGTACLAAERRNPSLWPELWEELGVTVFVAVPTVYRQILKYAALARSDSLRLRHVLCAGEALSSRLLASWKENLGCEMYEALGMTEISTYVSSGPETPVRPGSPGTPQPGRRVCVLPLAGESTDPLPPGEVGLLAVHRSDPGLMLRYWNCEHAEEAEVYRGEWFVGGDLAAFDHDGYLWFHGRADDVINAFGHRLSPLEIEQALESHPEVLEAAVVGRRISDEKLLVTACVVRREGSELGEDALRAHLRERLAAYKQPHAYCFLPTLPRTANGKLQRSAVRESLV